MIDLNKINVGDILLYGKVDQDRTEYKVIKIVGEFVDILNIESKTLIDGIRYTCFSGHRKDIKTNLYLK